MPFYPIFFIVVVLLGISYSFRKGPIWGLITYVFVYFNIPSFQWWGEYVPDIRWSYWTAILLILSCIKNKNILIKRPEKNLPYRYLIALLLITIFVVPLSEFPQIAWGKVYEFFRYVVVFYLVYRIIDDYEKFKYFLYIFLSCTFYLCILARHYFTGERLDGVGLPDASDANMLAALMLLVIPSLIMFILHGSKRERLCALAASPFIVNTFMMTRSRGGFVGLVLELLLLSLFVFRTVRKDQLLKISGGAILVLYLFISLMDPKFKERLFDVGDSTEIGNLDSVSAGRLDLWYAGLELHKDYPYGTGGGTYQLLIPDYLAQRDSETQARASHNTYLLVLVEQGILGLIIYLLFLRKIFSISRAVSVKIPKLKEDETLNSILYHNNALGAALAGFFCASFFVERIYFEGIYLITALIPCLYQIKKRYLLSLETAEVKEKI